jgi:hypothetical protein
VLFQRRQSAYIYVVSLNLLLLLPCGALSCRDKLDVVRGCTLLSCMADPSSNGVVACEFSYRVSGGRVSLRTCVKMVC